MFDIVVTRQQYKILSRIDKNLNHVTGQRGLVVRYEEIDKTGEYIGNDPMSIEGSLYHQIQDLEMLPKGKRKPYLLRATKNLCEKIRDGRLGY